MILSLCIVAIRLLYFLKSSILYFYMCIIICCVVYIIGSSVIVIGLTLLLSYCLYYLYKVVKDFSKK